MRKADKQNEIGKRNQESYFTEMLKTVPYDFIEFRTSSGGFSGVRNVNL